VEASRRSFFTALSGGGLGLSGCASAPDVPAAQDVGAIVLRLSPPGSVDLNSTGEQAIDIPHGSLTKPSTANVVLIDVIQDDPHTDTTALRWAVGYPVYDEAASTDTNVRVLVKFAAPAGVPVTGRARVLFERPARAPGVG
jgi:hypothetical protein